MVRDNMLRVQRLRIGRMYSYTKTNVCTPIPRLTCVIKYHVTCHVYFVDLNATWLIAHPKKSI